MYTEDWVASTIPQNCYLQLLPVAPQCYAKDTLHQLFDVEFSKSNC